VNPILLAYRPFLDPIDAHAWWFLLLPLFALGVALAFKSVRCGDLRHYPKQVALMTLQIIVGILALGIGLLLFVRFVLPLIAPMPG
jgi:CHASE2 domain-containing sensor protein